MTGNTTGGSAGGSGSGSIGFWRQMRGEMPGIIRLAIPVIVGLAASTLLGVTDSLMLAPLGPVPLAAVGLTSAVALVFFAAVYGLISVMGVRIGAAFGARAGRRIPFLLRNGLALGALVGGIGTVLMGLCFWLLPLFGQPEDVLAALPAYWAAMSAVMLPYAVLTVFKTAFEATDRAWLGTGFAFLAVVINIPLNYVLIWGPFGLPAFGLTGAGIASLAAETLALLAAWAYWSRARPMRRLRLGRKLDWREIGAAGREGAPLGLLYVAETGAMAVGAVLIGTFGTVALAAHQVVSAVGGLLYMLPLGVAGAVALRVSQARGGGSPDRLRAIVWAALVMAQGWLFGAMLILIFAGRAIAAAITPDLAVVTLAAQLFVAVAALQLLDGVQSTMLGALRGMSDTTYPALVTLLAYWVVGLPAGAAMAHLAGLGPVGIWLGFGVGLIGAAVLLTLRFQRRTAV